MRKLAKEQIEEYRHRINNNSYVLHKVNAEIIYYLDQGNYLDDVFSGIDNYRDKIFKALASNDHSQRLAYGKELMKDLWEIELAFGCYPFADVLAEFEFGRQYYSGYRDHVLHQLKVYLLGLYLYFGCKSIQNLFISQKNTFKKTRMTNKQEFMIEWKLASLSHDHGYIFETLNSEKNQWIFSKVLPIFNNNLTFPLSGLSDIVRQRNFNATCNKYVNKLINCLASSSISHTKEERLKHFIEVANPIVHSVNDIVSFRDKDLFDDLHQIGITTSLAINNNNAIKQYFEYASRTSPSEERLPFRDHGIASALILLLQKEYNIYYSNKLRNSLNDSLRSKVNLTSDNIEFIKGLCDLFEDYSSFISNAASAVSVHNIDKNTWACDERNIIIAESNYNINLKEFKIIPHKNPLAFLLRLVDTLQNWDRPTFATPSIEDLKYQSDQDLSITLDNSHVYLSFPANHVASEQLQKIKDELYSCIDKQFVDELIRELPWNGIKNYKLTTEAISIETPGEEVSKKITNPIFKHLTESFTTYDNFEVKESIDTRNHKDFLLLVKDLVAMANSGGGYIAFGIKKDPFELLGIKKETYLFDIGKLLTSVNLYLSNYIVFDYRKLKILCSKDKFNIYNFFILFYVVKSNSLIYLSKDGIVKEEHINIFSRNDIYIRKDAKTVKASVEDVKDMLIHAQLDNDQDFYQSIILIQKKGIAPTESTLPLKGDLPTPDYDKLIGRDEEVKMILDKIYNPKVYSLTIDGVGGCGKSAIALYIANKIKYKAISANFTKHKNEDDFDIVVWATAKTCELTPKGILPKLSSAITLDVLIDNIADSMGANELKALDDFEEKKLKLIELLEGFKCLIIIDNLETVSDIHKKEIINFLEDDIPQPTKVLYTTRSTFHSGHTFRVLELTPDNAVLLAKELALQFNNFEVANNDSLIDNITIKTGRIPLGIKWAISRICQGYCEAEMLFKKEEEYDLLRFCFEETFNKLTVNEKDVLFAIASCDFVPDMDNIEYITSISRYELNNSIGMLEALSLVKRENIKLVILPLTKDYSKYELQKEPKKYEDYQSRIKDLFQIDETISDSLPIVQRLALKLHQEAIAAQAMDNILDAITKLEQAYNTSKEAYIVKSLSALYEKRGANEKIELLIQDYLTINPNDYLLLKKLGMVFKNNNNHDEALKSFTRASKINPADKDIWHYKGLVERLIMFKNKKTPIGYSYCLKAIESFKKALREAPSNNSERNFNSINCSLIARCYCWKNDIKKSLEYCKLGLKENPHNFTLLEFAATLGDQRVPIEFREI